MPRGDKSKYTEKQKRKAEHIEDSYKERGVNSKEAASRAWPRSTRSPAAEIGRAADVVFQTPMFLRKRVAVLPVGSARNEQLRRARHRPPLAERDNLPHVRWSGVDGPVDRTLWCAK